MGLDIEKLERFIDDVTAAQGHMFAHYAILREIVLQISKTNDDPAAVISEMYDSASQFIESKDASKVHSFRDGAQSVLDTFFSDVVTTARSRDD